MLGAGIFFGAWTFGEQSFFDAWTLDGWTSGTLIVGRRILCGLGFAAVDFGMIDLGSGTAFPAPAAMALTEATGSVAPI
jgi:hypothetical protein